MLTPSYIVVKCFPSVKRASVYLVAYIDTGLGDLSYLVATASNEQPSSPAYRTRIVRA